MLAPPLSFAALLTLCPDLGHAARSRLLPRGLSGSGQPGSAGLGYSAWRSGADDVSPALSAAPDAGKTGYYFISRLFITTIPLTII